MIPVRNAITDLSTPKIIIPIKSIVTDASMKPIHDKSGNIVITVLGRKQSFKKLKATGNPMQRKRLNKKIKAIHRSDPK